MVDPDWRIAEEESLEDAKDETAEHEPEVPVIVGEDKARDGIAEGGHDEYCLSSDTLHDKGYEQGSHACSRVRYACQEGDLALGNVEVSYHLELRGWYDARIEVQEQGARPEERE